MTDFDRAIALVLLSEGGKVDLKSDPGGRTNKGITQATFDAWRKSQGLPKRDVWMISDADVAAIYRNSYANHIRFDDLPAGVAYCALDEAVNSGPIRAVKDLQAAVGSATDGILGAITLGKVKDADPAELIGKLCDIRLGFLRRLKAWATFGRGWSNRVASVRKNALAWPPVRTVIVGAGVNPVREMLR